MSQSDFITTALPYKQGGRQAYSFNVTLSELNVLLPSRDPDDLTTIKGANRAITAKHANDIRSYLEQQPNWVLGSIIAAIPADCVKYADQQINLPAQHHDKIHIIDGQHRRKAIGDLLTHINEDPTNQLHNQQINVILYEVDDQTTMRQMFAWLARAKPIDAKTRAQFDSADPFNNVALNCVPHSKMLADGRISAQLSTTKPASEFLITQLELGAVVTTLTLGPQAATTPALRSHYQNPDLQDKMLKRAIFFLDEFLPQVAPIYREILDGNLSNPHIAIRRADTHLLDPQMIRFIAICLEQFGEDDQWSDLAEQLVTMDFQKHLLNGNNDLANIGVIDPDTYKFRPKRAPEWRNAARQICTDARGKQPEPQE